MTSSKPTRALREANRPPPTTIIVGQYIANILADPKDSNIYHWIIQRINSSEVIFWSNENSLEEAERCAKQYIDELIQRDNRL
jgi:hypothetical protein